MKKKTAAFLCMISSMFAFLPQGMAETWQGEVIQVSGGGEWASVVPEGKSAAEAVQVSMDSRTAFDGYLTGRDVKVGDRVTIVGERSGASLQAARVSTLGANSSLQTPGDPPPGSGLVESPSPDELEFSEPQENGVLL